jgi:hypothetical protein
MDSAMSKIKIKESYIFGASNMSSTEYSGNGKLCNSGAPEGAAGQDSDSVSLESLTKRFSTPGFQRPKRNQCGAAKRRVSRARWEEACIGGSAGGKTRWPPDGQLHQGETSLAFGSGKSESMAGPILGAPGHSTSRDEGQLEGPGQGQRLSGGIPGVGRLRGPGRWGSLAMPGLPGMASGWPL